MRSRKPKTQPGFTRGPRIADLMTREHQSFLESSLAAERSGDAATALEYHRGIPMFTRGRHTYTLTQLAGLADEMTPWLWARWAAYQCNRAEDAGTESGFITRAALDYTLQMFYDDQMQAAYDEGRDPMEILKNVDGGELDLPAGVHVRAGRAAGVPRLHRRRAAGRERRLGEVVGRRGDARACGSSSAARGRLVVTDLKTRQEIELLDLGAGTLCEPGGFLVGRLVPSGTTPETMFDTTPVVVDQQTAQEVAASTRGGWITALHQGARRRAARAVGARERGPRAGERRARAAR